MICECVINSISSEGKVKLYIRSKEFIIGIDASEIILLKVILDKSGLHTNTTIMKDKVVLADLPNLMATHII